MDRDDSDGFEAILGLKSGGFVAIVLGCPLIFSFAGSDQSLGVRSTRSDWSANTTGMYSLEVIIVIVASSNQ